MQYCLSDKVFTNLQILYLLDTWGLAALQYMLQVTSKPRSACGDEGSGGGLWWVVAGPGPGPRVAEWRLPGPADIGSYSCYDAAALLPSIVTIYSDI